MLLDQDDDLTTPGGEAISTTLNATQYCSRAKDGGADRDWAAGPPRMALVKVTQDANMAGATSVDFQVGVESAVDGTNWTTLGSTGAIAIATLVKGYMVAVPLKPGTRTNSRYLQARAVIVGTATAGSKFIVTLLPEAEESRPQNAMNVI
jgi:hypothetical protein